MNREEILAMAKEIGFYISDTDACATPSDLERFFTLAYAAGARDMQERAAKVCTDFVSDNHEDWVAEYCADEIRNLEVR